MIINALNGVWSDIYILQSITQEQSDKDVSKRLDFKDLKFPVKIRDVKNSINISVFGYENKEKHPVYVSRKCCEDKHVDLLLIGEGEKKHYVLIKDFNTFMYDHTLHRERKHLYRYCRTAEKWKYHIKDCLNLMVNKILRYLRKMNILNSKILEEK